MALLTPAPAPGTVIYFNTYNLDDPGGRSYAHVLAVEESAVVSPSRDLDKTQWQQPSRKREVKVVIKVHVLVSINVPCVVHWGLVSNSKGNQWIRPDSELWPEGTEPIDAYSVESPMRTDPRSRMCRLELKLPCHFTLSNRNSRESKHSVPITGIAFVLKDVMTDRWIREGSGEDLYVRIRRYVAKFLSEDDFPGSGNLIC